MAGGLFLASQGTLPLEHLLRSGGSGSPHPVGRPGARDGSIGDGPKETAGALDLVVDDEVAADAASLLEVLATGIPAAWASGPFIARVEVARRHLAPITDTVVLAASSSREASRRLSIGRTSSTGLTAIRVAYGIRRLEITGGLDLPPWRAWIDWCMPTR